MTDTPETVDYATVDRKLVANEPLTREEAAAVRRVLTVVSVGALIAHRDDVTDQVAGELSISRFLQRFSISADYP